MQNNSAPYTLLQHVENCYLTGGVANGHSAVYDLVLATCPKLSYNFQALVNFSDDQMSLIKQLSPHTLLRQGCTVYTPEKYTLLYTCTLQPVHALSHKKNKKCIL